MIITVSEGNVYVQEKVICGGCTFTEGEYVCKKGRYTPILHGNVGAEGDPSL